ncbi:hypothetical protein EON65_21720, partial [archaeon]
MGVRKVTASTGIITKVMGSSTSTLVAVNVPSVSVRSGYSFGARVTSSGLLLFGDPSNNVVWQYNGATGELNTLVGFVSGISVPATSTRLNVVYSMWGDTSDNLYISEPGDRNQVLFLNASTGLISVFAGSGVIGNTAENIAATLASISSPWGVTGDSLGQIYISDYGYHRVRRVSLSGIITTVAGSSGSCATTSNVQDSATALTLCDPGAVVVGGSILYIADTGRYVIRRVNLESGIMSTLVGTGTSGFTNGLLPNRQISSVLDMWGLPELNVIYLADSVNYRIRVVNLTTISDYAGNGTMGAPTVGALSRNTRLTAVQAICGNTMGDVFFMGTGDRRMLSISASTRRISVIVGTGVSGVGVESSDNSVATQVGTGLSCCVDHANRIYYAESTTIGTRIRRAIPATAAPTISPNKSPTRMPAAPTQLTQRPTVLPSMTPSQLPTVVPSMTPSQLPTVVPSMTPSQLPTV